MTENELVDYFESYLKKKSLFENKNVLQSDYTPESLKHRDKEINSIAQILAPALRQEKPSNIFIYGKTGSGKTVTVRYTTEKFIEVAKKRNIPVKTVYVNCKLKKVADTEYRLIAQLIREFGYDIPSTGLPTEEVYTQFFKIVDSEKQNIILILDEIDQLVDKIGDEVLYSLTRINSELKNSRISFIGISNNLVFAQALDSRIKSSLSQEELVFSPYNALQIVDILSNRSDRAFRKGAIKQGVVQKCAAYAAREHGDARRALDLLRVAGEIAERTGSTKVEIQHIDEAEEKIEKDCILESIETQPKQFQAVLFSIMSIADKRDGVIHTGEVYEVYKAVCLQTNLRPLTQRRVSDIIGELDLLGIINAKTISKGRYGRTRDISVIISKPVKEKINSILKNKLEL
ncbi:ORC1-type DNA replication protein [Candidatus Woesearchaeota archaeon]|nr:ORC1-type DNA replication protein [Candidatus Woesearchaeota archaeon]